MSATSQVNIKKIIEMISRDNHAKFKTVGTWCMVGGIPNVGKSTLINAFKNISRDIKELSETTQKSAVTGCHPTTTRLMDSFKINLEPLIYIVDTPGIMPPKIPDPESGIKLSLCGNIKDIIAGKDLICSYLLYTLNKTNHKVYAKVLKLKEPTKDLNEVINQVAENFKINSTNNCYDYIIKNFKEGKFGRLTFDEKITKSLMKI